MPRQNRKLIMPLPMEADLMMDERFVTYASNSYGQLADGAVAHALGFDIYVSHDLTTQIITMVPEAVTFANQITKVDAYRPEKGFCDGVKGLSLCGAKVTMPEAVSVYTFDI